MDSGSIQKSPSRVIPISSGVHAQVVGRAIGGGSTVDGEPYRRAADVVPVHEGPVKDQLVVAWRGFVFRGDRFRGTPFSKNEEGALAWRPVDYLYLLPMWEGDRYFLPLVFDSDARIFHGYLPDKDGHPLSWNFTRI